MSSLKLKSSILFMMFVLFLSLQIIAKQKAGNNKKPAKVSSTTVSSTYIDINNIKALQENNGFSDFNLNTALEGLEYPKGSGKTAVFQSGLLWGGFVQGDSQVRVGGSTYISGLEPGPLLSNGQPADPNDSRWRIYRVRPDVYPGSTVDLSNDAALEGVSADQLKAQYESDWTEWPGKGTSNDLGAPFTDVNGDGIYEPNIDIPGVPGADQTIYYVANDEDPNLTNSLYGTQPLGIEVHATFWAYTQSGPFGNLYFKKFTLINKGYQHNTIDSMFISLWADPDLGNSSDDFAGTDTTVNLIYTYNSSSFDAVYAPAIPPAVGFHLVEGPAVPGGVNDTAFIGGKYISGKKNLPMTASYFFISGNPNYNDPPFGTASGSLQFYHFFNGQYSNGLPFIDQQGHVTKYVFSGDPVTGTGWLEGSQFTPSDIRQGLASGPFNFAPGDTQEVAFAELLADKSNNPGSYLTSITGLRNYAKYADPMYYKGVSVVISNPDFVNLNNAVNLQGNPLPNRCSVAGISWSIIDKPSGSSASIVNPNNLQASFTPDVIGDYKIKLSVNINGITASDTKIVKAVNNHNPVAVLKADVTEMTAADSLLLKYDETYDPDGDSLSYSLSGLGNFKYQFSSKTAYFFPNPDFIGNEQIQFTASDLYSYDSTALSIKVNPKLENVKVDYSYIDTSWILSHNSNPINGMPYFEGSDTLYVPLINSLKRYSISGSGITQSEELNNVKVNGIWGLKGNLLFTSTSNYMGYFGTIGKLTIYDLSNNANKVLADYQPGQQEIFSVYQVGQDIYLRDYLNAIYKVNFSNPAVPQIVSSGQILLNSPAMFKSDSQSLYFLGRNNNNSFSAKKLDRNTLKTTDSLTLSFTTNTNAYYNLIAHDSTLIAYDYNNPNYFSIYYFDGSSDAVLLKQVQCSSLFPNPFPGFYNPQVWSFGFSFVDKFLEMDGYSSSKLFDISDVNNIKLLASSYGGGMSFSRHGDNYYLMKSDPRYTSTYNPYSGINSITISSISAVSDKQKPNIPLEFKLSQNYPNPFNPTTIINYSVPKISFVTVKVYDMLGREVAALVNEEKKAGNYSINFNAGSLASGVYFYRMQAGQFEDTKKLILLK